jgi:tetratricopeptide (TPR) repeat protein
MSFSDAQQTLLQTLQGAKTSSGPCQGIRVTSVGFSFTDTPDRAHEYRFGEIHSLKVQNNPIYNWFYVDLGGVYPGWESANDARRFVDAIEALKYHLSGRAVSGDAAAFADFQEKAKVWRVLPVRPLLPDQVQRFKVLAEDAFQNKNFEEAVGYYEQGLAIEPLWPDGQLNAALFYGELQMYGQAVIHMKRYLELCPDAKDAKKCRNQMFIWEEKAKKATTPSSANRPPTPNHW